MAFKIILAKSEDVIATFGGHGKRFFLAYNSVQNGENLRNVSDRHDIPYGTLWNWRNIKGKKPHVVRALEAAAKRGFLDVDSKNPLFGKLHELGCFASLGGCVQAATPTNIKRVTFSAPSKQITERIVSLLKEAGVSKRKINVVQRSPRGGGTWAITVGDAVLARTFAAMGIPVSRRAKQEKTVVLPHVQELLEVLPSSAAMPHIETFFKTLFARSYLNAKRRQLQVRLPAVMAQRREEATPIGLRTVLNNNLQTLFSASATRRPRKLAVKAGKPTGKFVPAKYTPTLQLRGRRLVELVQRNGHLFDYAPPSVKTQMELLRRH